MEFEIMEKKHWESVAEIYQQGINSNLSTFETVVPTWEHWDENHIKGGRFVAIKDNKVTGFIILSATSRREVYSGVCELSVYVHEDYRGYGVGTALINKEIEYADNNGIWTLQSGILEENEGSLQLHERCGFVRVGLRNRIAQDKFKNWRNVILMERRSRKIGFEGCDMSACPMKDFM